jgi:hypothetical protein
VLPLVNVPVAEYRRLVPWAKLAPPGVIGLIAIDAKLAASTVTVAVPLIPLNAAVIVTGVVVIATPVAKPLTVILTLVVSDDVQVATFVMSC